MAVEVPEVRAANFARIIRLVYSPTPANPEEERLEEATGDSITIRSFSSEGDRRAVPGGFAEVLRQKTTTALKGLHITQSFAGHILETVDEALSSGLMRMLGPDYILSQCGIIGAKDKDRIQPGFFIDESAPKIEREAIRLNYPNQSIFEAGKHIEKMDRWVEDYTKTNGSNPLED